MTNEEKAKELAIKSTRDIDDKGNEVYNCLVEAALQEMAAWKEKQMIEKVVKWMLNNHIHYPNNGIGTEQIIEDFKKAMKEE